MTKPAGNQSLVSNESRDRLRGVARPIALAMGRIGLTPNGITVIGFIGTCIAAIAAASQWWLAAGILVIAFGIFDMFDGALARATGRASKFGAFLDSTLDRTGENLVLAGVAYGTAVAGYPVIGDVGIAPRPERLVILSVGLALAALPWAGNPIGGIGNGNTWLAVAVGLISLLSAITIVQRIFVVRRQLDQNPT